MRLVLTVPILQFFKLHINPTNQANKKLQLNILKTGRQNLSEKRLNISTYAPNLKKGKEGIWHGEKTEKFSYPASGNNLCFEIEDKSFWFQHRNACIIELVKRFPPQGKGPIFDVGGGNGFVAKGLADAGWDVVLVEPGSAGARNAKKRGLQHVVCATTQTAGFKNGCLPAIGVFDVTEHIKDDVGFLKHLHDLLEPGGMLYLTVPAYNLLWSDADIYAGHFKRYNFKTLEKLCSATKLNVRFLTGVFSWLIAPLLIFRALPYRLVGKSRKDITNVQATMNDHKLPAWLERFVSNQNDWEVARISRGMPIPLGASLLLAVRKSH